MKEASKNYLKDTVFVSIIMLLSFFIIVYFPVALPDSKYKTEFVYIGRAIIAVYFLIISGLWTAGLVRSRQANTITEKIDGINALITEKNDGINALITEKNYQTKELIINTAGVIVIGGYRAGIAECNLCINNNKTHTVLNTYIYGSKTKQDDQMIQDIAKIMLTFLKKPENRWIDIISDRNRNFLQRFVNKAEWEFIQGIYECYELKRTIPLLNFTVITQGYGDDVSSDVFFGWGLHKGAATRDVIRSHNVPIARMFDEIHKAMRDQSIAENVPIKDLIEAARNDFRMPRSTRLSDGPLLWHPITSANYVGPHIADNLDNYLFTSEKPIIFILGYELFYIWPIIVSYLNKLLKRPAPNNVNIRIAIVDPSWENCSKYSEKTVKHVRKVKRWIKNFFKDREIILKKHGWSISLFTYKDEPRLFGILVGDRKLFLGTVSWDNEILRGSENVEEFTSSDPVGNQRIEEFKSLFKTFSQRRVDIGFDKDK